MENIFKKTGESSGLSISEIIDSKGSGYLSAWNALLQNSFRKSTSKRVANTA